MSRTAYAAQRILDLVGQAAHELARRLLYGQLRCLAIDAQKPIQRLHLYEQTAELSDGHRRDREVDAQLLPGCRDAKCGLALGEGLFGYQRLQQLGLKLRPVPDHGQHVLTPAAHHACREQEFGRLIQVAHAQRVIDQHYGGRLVVENVCLERIHDGRRRTLPRPGGGIAVSAGAPPSMQIPNQRAESASQRRIHPCLRASEQSLCVWPSPLLRADSSGLESRPSSACSRCKNSRRVRRELH